MTDVVEQLRHDRASDLELDAAYEIERLRKLLNDADFEIISLRAVLKTLSIFTTAPIYLLQRDFRKEAETLRIYVEAARAALKAEGTLQMQRSGRWAVCRPGRRPVEISSGELFRVELAGASDLQATRMEYDDNGRRYYSVDGYPLRDGLRAAFDGHR